MKISQFSQIFSHKRNWHKKEPSNFAKLQFLFDNIGVGCRDLGPKKYTLHCKLISCVLIWCKFYINFVEKKVDDRGGCYYLDRFPVSSVSKNGAQIFLKLQMNSWSKNNCIWMPYWRHTMVDGANFWISYQQLTFLSTCLAKLHKYLSTLEFRI